jgi:hypothetical protein
MIRSLVCGAAAVSLLTLALASAGAADEPPGVLWETTSQPVMQGMPMSMPAQTQKTCSPREWTRPPAGGNPGCTSSNWSRTGTKATWTVTCTGEMPMTGTGEMTFNGDDSYSGTIRLTGGPMAMTVNLTGRKIGTCNDPQ